jgi:hypothetical protein
MTTASIAPPPAAQHLHEVLELEQLDTNLFRSKVNQVKVAHRQSALPQHPRR